MAGASRTATDLLTDRLAEAPFKFDFFQAVRRLEAVYRERPRVGASYKVAQDSIRFCQEPSLAFPPCTVAAFQPNARFAPRMFVNFLGLLGPNGPMPLHVTELARHRQRNMGDSTLARFLDVFNHRMVSLFYRAWAVNNQAVSHDRPEDDRFAVYIATVIGRGMASLVGRDSVPDNAKFHYSGRLSGATWHAEGLEAMLADFFKTPVRVIEFFGQWLDLPAEYCCRMGESPKTGLLGSTCVVGSRVWECQQKFRLRMGPMGLAQFERLLPGQRSLQRVVDWIRNYIGDELLWDLQLVLKAEEVPKIQMGKQGRLGWTTWLASRPFEKDADDLVLRPGPR